MIKKRNNRNAGNSYERQIVKELRQLGYEAVTSRSESRNADAAKIDVISTDFPFHVQVKNTTQNFNVSKFFLDETLRQDKPYVVMHKKTRKRETNFVVEGEYVYLQKEEFYKLMRMYRLLINSIDAKLGMMKGGIAKGQENPK